MSAVILIIVHKPDPSLSEKTSLKRCFNILGNHPIILICPEGLDISVYKKVEPRIRVRFIDPKWQSTYAMFNRLKIDPFLYKQYRQFEYILFYELDAWVFRDDLEYWCKQGYDYIGAPWFDSYTDATSDSKFLGVGNGGFSLRKIKSHLKALHTFSYVRMPKIFLKEFLDEVTIDTFIRMIACWTIRNNTHYLCNDYKRNEDVFWGKVVANNFDWFKVPNIEIASSFSMELNAPMLYEKHGNRLPFGCHKWEKYHPEFWRRFIQTDTSSLRPKEYLG